ncbi:hypothetical protein, partial [Escherichia coli]
MSGKPAARQGDMTQYGGSIVQGSAGVRIGAPTGVACSVCPGGVTSGHSRSESLWLVRGGVAKLDEGHRLAALWQALPEELRLSPHRYLATNSPQGPWWLLGWCER